jgi:hypothetical protein
MTFKYRLFANEDSADITVFTDDGRILLASSKSHPNIQTIIQAAIDGDESVVDLFDPAKGIARQFKRLSNRITINDEGVYLDGDPAPKALSDAIVAHYDAGLDGSQLVEFLERLGNNPSPQSVEQLYAWLDANDGFTIDEEGNLIGYKGVAIGPDGDGYVSVNRGKAVVNGVEHEGAIPNGIGDVVEMPRSEVESDPAVGCSVGLHVGTYDYAQGWARGALLEVLVDPRDVVSVPTDCGAQKLRVCRYTVLDVIDAPHTVPVRGLDPEDRDFLDWGDYEYDDYDDYDEEHEDNDALAEFLDGLAPSEIEVGDTVITVASGWGPEIGSYQVVTRVFDNRISVADHTGWFRKDRFVKA